MSVLLMFFIIVVIINKAFKLFKLVLVVYCDSCCHWWYPENSGNQKNVYNAKKPHLYCVYKGNLYPSIHTVILGYFLSWSPNLYSWKCNLYYPRTQLLIQESQKTPACRYTARENPDFEVFFPYSRSKHGEILEMGIMNQISPHL